MSNLEENWTNLLSNIDRIATRCFFKGIATPIEISPQKIIIEFAKEGFIGIYHNKESEFLKAISLTFPHSNPEIIVQVKDKQILIHNNKVNSQPTMQETAEAKLAEEKRQELDRKRHKELKKYREEIMKKKLFPTSEVINFGIFVDIGELLLYFFPNSFKNREDAIKYYTNFCERAESLGEEQRIYKDKSLINNTIHVVMQIDMKSGQVNTWNYYHQNNCFGVTFHFFSLSQIKNEELKKDVQNLYRENLSFHESLKIGPLSGEVELYAEPSAIDITPYGLDYHIPFAEYDRFQFFIRNNKDLFLLPTNTIIETFREARTYYLEEDECKELEEQIKSKLSNNIEVCLDFDYNHRSYNARIASKFMHVFINTEYSTPAEIVRNYNTGREYYDIDIFRDEYYSAY